MFYCWWCIIFSGNVGIPSAPKLIQDSLLFLFTLISPTSWLNKVSNICCTLTDDLHWWCIVSSEKWGNFTCSKTNSKWFIILGHVDTSVLFLSIHFHRMLGNAVRRTLAHINVNHVLYFSFTFVRFGRFKNLINLFQIN